MWPTSYGTSSQERAAAGRLLVPSQRARELVQGGKAAGAWYLPRQLSAAQPPLHDTPPGKSFSCQLLHAPRISIRTERSTHGPDFYLPARY
ncbi:hypothetical protein LMH87_005067 [Akanthomyces muscarius]|uniref:Uncharacterized protein n=1 Tax=Akanthomyces muscarius TaxID=2231603 RepID=A0A9W8QN18_AKAMU|nr:hypothetical protein LMH87_005067 [Akanthomyces muscarius]KAJ4163332.1 hypothetical protein LMH87_005067 [Akanthomyces muscarius]